MMDENADFLNVNKVQLFQALGLVPADERVRFLSVVLIGELETSMLEWLTSSGTTAEELSTSFPLTVEQAQALRTRANARTWSVIKEAVEHAKEGVATIDWMRVKALTGVDNWSQFAKGLLGGLNRTFHNIAGVEPDAVLLFEGDGWVKDGHGDFNAGLLVIDGPAVEVLRRVCGFTETT